MSKLGLANGLWSALGGLKEQLKDTVIGSALNFVSDLLLMASKQVDGDSYFHVVSGAIFLKRYESFLRERVAATESEIDDKIVDEVFEAVDAILEDNSQE